MNFFFRVHSSDKVIYDFSYLDELIYLLHENYLQPGFELMGNPSNYFSNFENKTEVLLWMNFIEKMAKHYIGTYYRLNILLMSYFILRIVSHNSMAFADILPVT